MNNAEYFDNKRTELLDFMPLQYKKVLEIGCGNGNFRINCSDDCEYWGVEPNPEAAAKAEQQLTRVLLGFYEDVHERLPDGYFDLIVCNDVIEHLPDHEVFLKKIKSKLATNGVLIGSVPNIRFLPYLLSLLCAKDWRYEDSGVLDRTHLRFFTEKSLKQTFIDAGYDIEKFSGINPIKKRWGSVRKIFRSLKTLMQLSVLGADASFMQFAFRIVRRK